MDIAALLAELLAGASLPLAACATSVWREGDVVVRVVIWHDASELLTAIRARVFIDEQRVPLELEQDGLDPTCIHALAEAADGRPLGTGRLRPDGRIGRLAVLREQRSQGIGSALLRALMRAARERGLHEVELHAQVHATAFYERHGFRPEGETFLEAGISHIQMRAAL